jgi:hypothetical protein
MTVQFVPQYYAWPWFGLGLGIILAGLGMWVGRTLKKVVDHRKNCWLNPGNLFYKKSIPVI